MNKCDADSCKNLFEVDAATGKCVCLSYLFFLDGGCYNPCPIGYYANSTLKTCELCPKISPTCSARNVALTCLDNGEFNVQPYLGVCYCKANYLQFETYFTDNPHCVADCGAGFYKNDTTKQCEKCHETCAECEQYLPCKKCHASYPYFNGTQCQVACNLNVGYYQDDYIFRCVPCQYPCSQCFENSTKCTDCALKHYISGNTCLSCQDPHCNVCPTTGVCQAGGC